MRSFSLLFLLALAAPAQNPPRAEHPNPQFMRPQWATLNGQWEFDFDDNDQGLKENWADPARKFSRKITVPYAFETKLSGIGDTSFHPVVWYRRALTVPAEWKAKRTLLCFGAVDYHATVWVNGRYAGEHEGGGTPFKLDVTGLLKPSGNTVTVRAFDPPTDRAIPRGKQYWEPKSRSIFYTRTSGIWQPVWIEAAGESYLDFFRVETRLDGMVKVETRLAHASKDLTLALTVRSEGRLVATASSTGVVEGKYLAAALGIGNPRLWSVDRPALYDLTVEVKNGDVVVDRVESYFRRPRSVD